MIYKKPTFEKIKLESISFEIKKAEYQALLSPTEYAKTSPMQSIAGISTNAQGQILFYDNDINLLPVNNKAAGIVSALHDFGKYLELKITINKDVVLIVHSSINDSANIYVGKAVCLDWPEDSMHIITKE